MIRFVSIGGVLLAANWGNPSPPIKDIHTLSEKYPPAVRQNYENYTQQYAKAHRLQDFITVYKTLTTQEENFSAPLQEVWEKYWLATDRQKPGQAAPLEPNFDWVNAAFPGMTLKQEAEGSVMILRPSWKSLSALAKRTVDSTQDDRFTKLMLKLHGDHWSHFPEWMEQTWDYGGCSRLGSGKHMAFLKEIQIQIKGGSAFKETLREQEKLLINDLLEAKELCSSKANALREFNEIERHFSWSTQQRQAFATQRKRISTGKVSVMGAS